MQSVNTFPPNTWSPPNTHQRNSASPEYRKENQVFRAPRPIKHKTLCLAKAAWTAEETSAVFRAMAEYMYIDANGIKPLAIYLSAEEMDHVEMCQDMQYTDSQISKALGGRKNAQSGAPHLFAVIRHLQRHARAHSIREVNEKFKNTRSRIINWFATMFAHGTLPNSKPAKYIVAMAAALKRSPFLPRDTHIDLAKLGGKHDIDMWLDAMCWLHPRKMYSFLLACALRVARERARNMPKELRTQAHKAVLGAKSPALDDIFSVLYQLVCSLQQRGGSSRNGSVSPGALPVGGIASGESDGKCVHLDSAAAAAASNGDIKIMCGSATVSSDMFYTLSNAEKVQLAGPQVKLIAAVGGVIRNSRESSTDIRYHMHRLWTCIARFKSINTMVSPLTADGAKPGFSEFVVVYDYMGAMDERSIEPHIRVSRTRVACTADHRMDRLVAQYVATSPDESRGEVPVWLAIVANADGTHSLALVICSSPDQPSSSLLAHRCFTDAEIANAAHHGAIDGRPVQAYGGMEPWPWTAMQASTVSMARQPIALTVCKASADGPPVVVSGRAQSMQVLLNSPWCEPRVLAMEAYTRQQGYAALNIVGMYPSYAYLAGASDKATGLSCCWSTDQALPTQSAASSAASCSTRSNSCSSSPAMVPYVLREHAIRRPSTHPAAHPYYRGPSTAEPHMPR
ncbi:hypothetical protein GGI22_001663 [Coemansia erecta]|nr:hypothetical protein GGI22_001663 [Coemansia erecta]